MKSETPHRRYFRGKARARILCASLFCALLCACVIGAGGFQAAAQTTSSPGQPMPIPPVDDPSTNPGCGEFCCKDQQEKSRKTILAQHMETRCHITRLFKSNQVWIMEWFFREHFAPALQLMTEQLITSAYMQMNALGAMLDAKFQMESQRLLQQRTADAHKSYQPSTEMCVVGTAVRGLAAAHRNAEVDALVLSERALDRELGNLKSVAATGPGPDYRDRLSDVIKIYCNKNDNYESLQYICPNDNDARRINNDINYSAMIGGKMTLPIDLKDTAQEDAEVDLFALAANLYNNRALQRIGPTEIRTSKGQETLMHTRALAAKRNMAYNSFGAIIAMKTQSPPEFEENAKFIKAIFKQMDIDSADEDDIEKLVGKRPSYYAMLQTLSQTIYRDPRFFTNLYDKPANVARKDVSMQAINLMLDRESYRSELRMEALLSGLLETYIMNEEDAFISRRAWLPDTKKEAPSAPLPAERQAK